MSTVPSTTFLERPPSRARPDACRPSPHPVELCHACCDAQSHAWHDDVPSHGGERGRASLMGSRWPYPLETGTPPAIQSTTRSPIMTTVACGPPDLGMRGLTDTSTTHNP